jgi:hypothetical protein
VTSVFSWKIRLLSRQIPYVPTLVSQPRGEFLVTSQDKRPFKEVINAHGEVGAVPNPVQETTAMKEAVALQLIIVPMKVVVPAVMSTPVVAVSLIT